MPGNAERGSPTRGRTAAEWIEDTHSLDEAPAKWQCSSSGYSSGQSAPQSLAVIREAEHIPRPIWPCAPCCCDPACAQYSVQRGALLRDIGQQSPPASSLGRVNPINCSLYQHSYPCYCSKNEEQARESERSSSSADRSEPTVFSLAQAAKCSSARIDQIGRATIACNCSVERLGSKRALSSSDARSDYPSIEQHEYTTLECSDSSSSDASALSKDNSWPKDFRGFDKNLDFTLDGFKAERLRRAIAKAKRRRQWCRFIVVIFGLVFFILSLVIVSLSLTKGRKVFGSM